MTCLLLLRNGAGLNEVTTMNPVSRGDVTSLMNDLEGLGALDRDQLKTRYLETLQREGRTRRGGAGLGLIEMTRRSGNVLRPGFTEIDAGHLRFTLSLDVDPATNVSSTSEDLQRWYSQAMDSELILLCKGLDNAAMEASLLRIMEQETADDQHMAGRSVSVAQAGLGMLQALGNAKESALALVGRGRKPCIVLLARAPLADSEAWVAMFDAVEGLPHTVGHWQRAVRELYPNTTAVIQAQIEPYGAGMARVQITMPIGLP
jgi:hypothetical protein